MQSQDFRFYLGFITALDSKLGHNEATIKLNLLSAICVLPSGQYCANNGKRHHKTNDVTAITRNGNGDHRKHIVSKTGAKLLLLI